MASVSIGEIARVTAGKFKDRIAYVDDDDLEKSANAIVYFGLFLSTPEFHSVPRRYLASVTTPILLDRYQELLRQIKLHSRQDSAEQQADRLLEMNLIVETLSSRARQVQLGGKGAGKRIFLSHSSKDKVFVRGLALDLGNAGHSPWLDEWEIRVGESIPTKVGEGLDQADAVAVVLSQNALQSRWVEREWQAKYWRELSEDRIMVLPILHENCNIPTLLATKRYADFRDNYSLGLNQLLEALA